MIFTALQFVFYSNLFLSTNSHIITNFHSFFFSNICIPLSGSMLLSEFFLLLYLNTQRQKFTSPTYLSPSTSQKYSTIFLSLFYFIYLSFNLSLIHWSGFYLRHRDTDGFSNYRKKEKRYIFASDSS